MKQVFFSLIISMLCFTASAQNVINENESFNERMERVSTFDSPLLKQQQPIEAALLYDEFITDKTKAESIYTNKRLDVVGIVMYKGSILITSPLLSCLTKRVGDAMCCVYSTRTNCTTEFLLETK